MSDAATAPAAPKLDELMLAMDVVDTLRHQHQLVRKELGQSARDEALKDRLREIYESQGLTVNDRILEAGIKALKESRFTYERRGTGWRRFFALMWVRRGLTAMVFAGVLVASGVAAGGLWWQATSAERAAEAARIEITETLPNELERVGAAVLADARTSDAQDVVNRLVANAQTAIAQRDPAGARATIAELQALQTRLNTEYELTIVQSPQSGVFRIPDVNSTARNYYLIVEAVTRDGDKLSLPIRNEETGATETVSTWGVRVPEATYNRVARDKRDDGIIQDNVLGLKPRGALAPSYAMPVSGGAITQW